MCSCAPDVAPACCVWSPKSSIAKFLYGVFERLKSKVCSYKSSRFITHVLIRIEYRPANSRRITANSTVTL
jgi:hypothetical protein